MSGAYQSTVVYVVHILLFNMSEVDHNAEEGAGEVSSTERRNERTEGALEPSGLQISTTSRHGTIFKTNPKETGK